MPNPIQDQPIVYELVDSQDAEASFDRPMATGKWIVLNVYDFSIALGMVYAAAPQNFLDLNFNNIRLHSEGGGVWRAEVMYVRWAARIPGSLLIQFDVSGETFKRTFAVTDQNGVLQQTYYTPLNPTFDPTKPISPTNSVNKPSQSFNGAIGVSNVNGEIKVDGVDEFAPNFAFTITRVFGTIVLSAPGTDPLTLTFPLSGDYVNTMFSMQRCVNSNDVDIVVQGIALHFNAGELWFQGGTAQAGSDGHSEVVLKFAANRNIVNTTIAGIPNVSARGWDLLEVYYEQGEDLNAHKMTPSPYQINVSQTKQYADLNQLFA